MTNSGSSGSQFHDRKVRPRSANQPRVCPSTISDMLRLPETSSTVTSTKPMASSYESICAEARKAPRNAYLEFDAQPATITPYTPTDVMAMIYSRPALTSASTTSGPNGTTAHAASAGISVTTGATTNRILLACVGTTTSLVSSLNTSAKGCNRPRKPTRVGPRRTCIAPIILRSQYVRYATHRMMGTAMM